MLKALLRGIVSVVRSRLFIAGAFFTVLFAILFYRLFVLQVVEGEDYLEQFTYRIQKETEIAAPRGTIYDCNGTVLAYDRMIYSVIIENSTLPSDNETRNTMIENLIRIVEDHGEETIYSIPMEIGEDGTIQFTGSDSTIRNFKKDIFGVNYTDSLSTRQEEMTAQELYDYMRGENLFNVTGDYTDAEMLKILALRYELYMTRYQRYVTVTVVSDVEDDLVAAIKENSTSLPGVTISQSYVREYNDSEYFAHITGYTGTISDDELEAFAEDGHTEYTASDTVGKTGIESVFEYELAGEKGSQTLYVNSLGSVLDATDVTAAVPGNDIYLTIDADLTKTIYDLLEEKIAGILLSKLVATVDEDNNENHLVPYIDVFHAFIENNIIDTEHFYESDATDLEKSVGERFNTYIESVISQIESILRADTYAPQSTLSDEYNSYCNYIYTWARDNGILNGDLYDADEEVYSQWENGEIGLGDFFEHAIAQGWIDTSLLNISGEYVDTSEVYDALVTAILNGIRDDSGFQKRVYKYMLSSETITEREICLLLYDQGILSKEDDDYNSLVSSTVTARSFIYNKIYNMEITPDMLALDTCSGAVIVTDPNSGEVKALVSYPSYDANRISDPEYYASLLSNESRPLFNRATQQTSAPGSTYKPLSAIAGLEEGLIDLSTEVYDRTVFDKVVPSARCWSSVSHGSVNVIQAIGVSCNYFFYELGYNAALTADGTEDDEQGLELLAKYAEMFGFNQTTGIEIGEASPNISDESSVRSFIGQGTNNYTATQVNRYTAALANRGTVYNLSLVDRITDHEGNLVEDFTPEVLNDLTDTIQDSTWNAVQQGMWYVTNETSSYQDVFTSLDVEVAGKSGTAQESDLKPEHAWFTGFAPYSDPQIAVTVRISNGYGSTNVVDTFRDSIAAYFNLPLYDSLQNDSESSDSGRHALLPINYNGGVHTDDGAD